MSSDRVAENLPSMCEGLHLYPIKSLNQWKWKIKISSPIIKPQNDSGIISPIIWAGKA